jgi:hypothetical protein
MGGAEMQMDRRPVRERATFGGEQAQACIEPVRRLMQQRIHQPVAAADPVLVHLATRQRHGATLSRTSVPGRPIVDVKAAHAHLDAGWGEAQPVPDRDLAGDGGAGHDGADAGQREGPIHRQTEVVTGVLPDPGGRRSEQPVL